MDLLNDLQSGPITQAGQLKVAVRILSETHLLGANAGLNGEFHKLVCELNEIQRRYLNVLDTIKGRALAPSPDTDISALRQHKGS